VLSNINYQINDGDMIVILGSNGSGKSSLLKIINSVQNIYIFTK